MTQVRPHVVMTICRDEVDIISTFVRFYLAQGFDLIAVVDNGSTDGTPEAVAALAATGLPVRLWLDARIGYERYLTEHFHMVGQATEADWLFFLDADEFILFPRPAREYLSALPNNVDCLTLGQKEMYPSPNAHAEPAGFLLTTRAEPRLNDTTKDMARYRRDARVFAGKHRVDFENATRSMPDDIVIRHYKYRSLNQAQRKEENRVQAHASYSDEDLAAISAFGVAQSRGWIDFCRAQRQLEAWRDRFAGEVPWVHDDALSRWAQAHLIADSR